MTHHHMENTMQAMQEDILSLEQKYWDAMKKNDVDTLMDLTKFPCVVAGPQGAQSITEEAYRAMIKKTDGRKYEGLEIQNPQTHIVNDTTAIITYGISCDGKEMLDVSTWVRDSDKWACAFHSETPVQ